MPLGDFKLFQWKTKQQEDKEAAEYAKWAFPFGEAQKEKLMALLGELRPKENDKTLMVSFLTCKEIWEGAVEDTETCDDALLLLGKQVKKYASLIKKKDITTYLAVVLADSEIDEQCDYPSVDEIRKQIQELDLKLL